jgi:hypothetical protein
VVEDLCVSRCGHHRLNGGDVLEIDFPVTSCAGEQLRHTRNTGQERTQFGRARERCGKDRRCQR